jgi:hypothetical protein
MRLSLVPSCLYTLILPLPLGLSFLLFGIPLIAVISKYYGFAHQRCGKLVWYHIVRFLDRSSLHWARTFYARSGKGCLLCFESITSYPLMGVHLPTLPLFPAYLFPNDQDLALGSHRQLPYVLCLP